ncbi:MAG: PQQ-binding-like beta-propeller repeat protein [Acidobacteriota bacterium]
MNITWKLKILVLNAALTLLALFMAGCSSNIAIPAAKFGSPSYSMFGGNSSRRFFVPVNIGDTLKLKWEGEINGGFSPTSVTAFENYVFVPDLSGRIYAFNGDGGKEIGFIKYKGAIVPAPIINEFVLTFPLTGYKENNSVIYNFNFHSGQETAKYEVDGKVESEPVKTKDGVIFLTEQGKAVMYDNANQKVWEYDTKGFIHSSAALSGDRLIFGNDKGNVYSLNARTGTLNYEKKIGSGFEGGFAISGDTVFTADNSGVLYCLRLSSGDLLWKYPTGYKINIFPAFDASYVYVGNLRGEVFKLSKSTGKLLWKVSTQGVVNTTPLLFNDFLVQPDLNKKLYFINVENGQISKTMYFEGRVRLSPVYYNETLYLGVDNGKVMAYERAK